MKSLLKTKRPIFLTLLFAALLLNGCASSKINWNSRVGNYTHDQAVIEMGPPERSAKLSDGRVVSEWLMFRGRSGGHRHLPPDFYSPYYGSTSWYHSEPAFPDQFVRLTFSPDGRLENWKKVAK